MTQEEWAKYMKFWLDPKNLARSASNKGVRAKRTSATRRGSRSLIRLQREIQVAATLEEPSPSYIENFFLTHTVNGIFPEESDRLLYEEMRRMEAEWTHTDVEIVKIVRGGKQRGHIPGIGPIVPPPQYFHMAPPAPAVDPRMEFIWDILRSDSRYSDAFARFESAGASGSGTGGASGSGTGGESGSGSGTRGASGSGYSGSGRFGSAGASGSGGFCSAEDDQEDDETDE